MILVFWKVKREKPCSVPCCGEKEYVIRNSGIHIACIVVQKNWSIGFLGNMSAAKNLDNFFDDLDSALSVGQIFLMRIVYRGF